MQAPFPRTVAINPLEFQGIKPRLLVKEGDKVKLGSPLFHSKSNEAYQFTSPASGRITAIKREHKRVISDITIKTDTSEERVHFQSYLPESIRSETREVLLKQLLSSGFLSLFHQRPFDHVADPSLIPRDIFISAMDTAPLAADPAFILEGNEAYFQAGLDVASRLTTGSVHLCIDGSKKSDTSRFNKAKHVTFHRVSGSHPAGCSGIHIHHIAPIRHRHDIVWYSTVQGMILIGKLFIHGVIDPTIMVALAGSVVNKPCYIRTVLGTSIESIVYGKIADDANNRYISGNVLTGSKVERDGHLGFYHNLLTILSEARHPEFLGWMMPGLNKDSIHRAILSAWVPQKYHTLDTRLNGGKRAFISTGIYEKVLPMNLHPMALIKSILAKDIDEMEGLGIYEVGREEFALCEYICPSKSAIQQIIRAGLDFIEKEA